MILQTWRNLSDLAPMLQARGRWMDFHRLVTSRSASNSMRSPCLRYVLERALEFACTQYGVKQAYVFTLVLVDSDVHETGVFVTLELVDRIVHQRAVEHA